MPLNSLSLLTLVLFEVSSLPSRQVTFDGGAIRPLEQRVSYNFRCPAGVFVLEVKQRRDDVPTVTGISFRSRTLTRTAGGPINSVLAKLRTLESVSARCRSHGGLIMFMAGLERDRVPAHRLVTGVTVDGQGNVSLS